MQVKRCLHHLKIMIIASDFLRDLYNFKNLLDGVDIAGLCQLILPWKTAIAADPIWFEESFTDSILVEFECTR